MGDDRSIPPEGRTAAFGHWVSAFHTPLSELTENSHILASREEMDPLANPQFVRTTEQMPPGELASCIEPEIWTRLGHSMRSAHVQIWRRNVQRALINFDRSGTFGSLDVVLIWGDMTIPLMAYVTAYIEDCLGERSRDGASVRNIRFIKMEGANHFVRVVRRLYGDPCTYVTCAASLARSGETPRCSP